MRLFHANLFSPYKRSDFGRLKTECQILSGLEVHYGPLLLRLKLIIYN